MSRKQSARCEWREDADGVWWTACDNAYQFTVGGPKENGHAFCCYCGQPLRQTPRKAGRDAA